MGCMRARRSPVLARARSSACIVYIHGPHGRGRGSPRFAGKVVGGRLARASSHAGEGAAGGGVPWDGVLLGGPSGPPAPGGGGVRWAAPAPSARATGACRCPARDLKREEAASVGTDGGSRSRPSPSPKASPSPSRSPPFPDPR